MYTKPAREIARTPHVSYKIRVPGSTSNLGAGFDCFGLALKIYLTIRVTTKPSGFNECRVRTTGARENAVLPRNSSNLIYRAMAYVARHEHIELPPLDLAVHNEIPLASGLGSSAAAIVGGIKLCSQIGKKNLTKEQIVTYATEFEGHPDNVSPAVYGGFVVNCVDDQGNVTSLRSVWPKEIKVVIVSPQSQLPTYVARAALSKSVSRGDAVHNLQRTAMFVGALAQGRYELLWEAMRDRLHQPRRESLVPGLSEALAFPRSEGVLGIALSGAGPSILALVESRADEIGEQISGCFRSHGIRSVVRTLEVDNVGARAVAAAATSAE